MTEATRSASTLPRVYELEHSLSRFSSENYDGPPDRAYDGWLLD
jgi:hypothetical protein